MYRFWSLRVGLLLACILGCQASSAQQSYDNGVREVPIGKDAFTVAEPTPGWVDQLPIPEATTSQPVVVRLADTQYFLGQVPALYVRKATQINDAASLSTAGRLSISFAPENERVQLHAIRIHRGKEQFDRTSSSDIRFLQREQNLERGVHSGRITASILINDLRVGDTVEVAYTISGQNPVFGGKTFGLSPWDQGFPTSHRRLVLNYPVERPITWRIVGDRPAPVLTPTDTIKDGVRRITFDEQPLPNFSAEARTSPDFFGARFLQFSEFANWSGVVDWADSLFEFVPPPENEFRDVVNRIKALPSDEARAVAALEFVQSQIRYFSVSLGESSHRPTPPDEVLRRRYGDCKDKSLLLIALLRELGIEGKPVLLQLERHAGLERTLPSPQFFDHAIVRATVGGKLYFLDPTRLGQHGQLSRMGQLHEGSQVLIVDRGTKSLSLISTEATDIVGDEITERAKLARFGSEGKLEVRHVWRGIGAEHLRILIQRTAREQIVKVIGDAMERRYPGAELAGDPVIRDELASNEFSITANYKIPKLATEAGDYWVVAFSPENLQNMVVLSPSANRATPLRIPGFPFHGKYSFETIFPEQVNANLDPRAKTVSNKYFSAAITEYFHGNVFRKTVDLKTLRAAVEAADYSRYADDLRSANKRISGVIGIKKAFLSFSAGSAGSVRPDLTPRLPDRKPQTIKQTTATIGNGKQTSTAPARPSPAVRSLAR